MNKSINLIEPSLLPVFIACYVMRIIRALMTIMCIFNVSMQLMYWHSFSFSLRVTYIHYTRFIMIKYKMRIDHESMIGLICGNCGSQNTICMLLQYQHPHFQYQYQYQYQ